MYVQYVPHHPLDEQTDLDETLSIFRIQLFYAIPTIVYIGTFASNK